MKLLKSTSVIVIAFVVVSSFGNAARAELQNEFRSRENGDWDQSDTWEQKDITGGITTWINNANVPDSNDLATVRVDDMVCVASATTVSVNDLVVNDSASNNAGILEIETGSRLEVDSSVDVENTAAYPGVFRFAGAGNAGELRSTAIGVTLSGPFTVTGPAGGEFGSSAASNTFTLQADGIITSDSGAVTISAVMRNDGIIDATTNLITITAAHTNALDAILRATGGAMTVTGTLENDGIALVNGANMTFSGQLDTGSTGMFRVASNHTMTFTDGSEVTGDIAAHFNVQNGTMVFSGSHSTTGGYKQTGGKVQADAGETFEAEGAYNANAGT